MLLPSLVHRPGGAAVPLQRLLPLIKIPIWTFVLIFSATRCFPAAAFYVHCPPRTRRENETRRKKFLRVVVVGGGGGWKKEKVADRMMADGAQIKIPETEPINELDLHHSLAWFFHNHHHHHQHPLQTFCCLGSSSSSPTYVQRGSVVSFYVINA